MKLKIAIIVHGRFHAFDLTRALLARGHEVTLFTNYPKWAVKRFGIPGKCVESFWLHGVLARAMWNARETWRVPYPEAWLHRCFSRWVAAKLQGTCWDLIHCWSGVSEEILDARRSATGLYTLMRGSAHIGVQARLLQEEEIRTGSLQDKPSNWMIAREEREYSKADYIVVLSSFAHRTFLEAGIPPEKLVLNSLGVESQSFRPPTSVIEDRCQRILAGAPLRILYVGTKSFRKGMWDLAVVIRQLAKDDFRFRLVGPPAIETQSLLTSLQAAVELIPKQPQNELFVQYAWGDVFLFPTIEDGFAAVLAQANASALPVLTTTNCGGPDLIQDGVSGWIVPIRRPDILVERLHWCHTHRQELAAMVRQTYANDHLRTWADTAAVFEALCQQQHGQ